MTNSVSLAVHRQFAAVCRVLGFSDYEIKRELLYMTNEQFRREYLG